MSCIFCEIAAGKTDTQLIYQDDHVVAFDDLHPKAPHHKLIIPRQHIATVNDVSAEQLPLVGSMMQAVQNIAKELGVAEPGYRVVINCNAAGGQIIYHLHWHLLAGAQQPGF